MLEVVTSIESKAARFTLKVPIESKVCVTFVAFVGGEPSSKFQVRLTAAFPLSTSS